jgi:hypothetical protein
VLADRKAFIKKIPDSRPSSPVSETATTVDTVTIGLDDASNDLLSLATLEKHFEWWKRCVAHAKAVLHYPSLFGYPYQPLFHGRLEAIDNLRDTIVGVTGSAWAIPFDGRINLSFSLAYLRYPGWRRFVLNTQLNNTPDETPEDELEYAASQIKNLGQFDRKLHTSENRGFFVADFDPWTKHGDSANGSFVIYKFGAQPSEGTEVQWDPNKNKISWEEQRIEFGHQYVTNPRFTSPSSHT